MAAKGRIFYALLFFVAVLTFFWPIPRTIAVRHISLALSVITLWIIVYNSKNIFRQNVLEGYAKTKPILISLALTTFWFYFVAIFVSPETEWSLKELNGQWLISTTCFLLGFSFLFFEATTAKRVFIIFFIALMVHIIYLDLSALKLFVDNNGQLPLRLNGLTEGCDKANYITNWALAFACVDMYFRATKKTKIIPVDNFIIFCCFLLILLSSYFETMRFGFLGLFVTLFGFLVLYLFLGQNNLGIKKLLLIAPVILLILSIFGYNAIKADERWDSFIDTIPIALDTNTNQAWKGFNTGKYEIPKLPNGEFVNESNYDRIAWAKEGFILITENPFGIGYGRNAFGHGLKAKYGEGGGHSHSGIIDLGIGTGFIGMGLWVVFLASLMYYGFRSFKKDESYFGMILLFIVSGFFFRMIVDSVIRDHMLEQFMFLVGLLLALSIKEINEKNSTSTV